MGILDVYILESTDDWKTFLTVVSVYLIEQTNDQMTDDVQIDFFPFIILVFSTFWCWCPNWTTKLEIFIKFTVSNHIVVCFEVSANIKLLA